LAGEIIYEKEDLELEETKIYFIESGVLEYFLKKEI
jgi:hypothetical protein